MPITATEASRLSRRTGLSEDQFCSKDESGIRRLLNNQDTKACVFLATGSDLVTAPGILLYTTLGHWDAAHTP